MLRQTIAPIAALMLATAATQASAHAHLVASDPAPNSEASAPKQIVLQFSERLQPRFSGLTVSMGGMAAPLRVAVSADRKSLIAVPSRPLAAGAYKVDWHAVSVDTHRVQGTYLFKVR